MALDPEELKRRRAQRKLKRKRTGVVRLAIAAVAVVLLIVMIVVLASNRKRPDSDATTAPVDTTVIHMAAAGDLNVTEKVVAAGGENYDYTGMMLDVAHLLADADITALNFEGNFYGAPYGTDRSAPQALADALARAGVDVLQLANTYSIYKGTAGLSSSINAVKLAGMEPLGVYATAKEAKEAKGYTIKTVQGIKIAFVGFTKGMDGMALPPGNEGCVNVLYTDYATDYQQVDTEGITKVLRAAAKERPDLTVAMVHWGSDFNDNISKSQTAISQLMLAEGVDVILGTHPHYLQKMEFDPAAGTFVAYSLGDFVGDASRAGSEYSLILNLEITRNNETGQTKVSGFDYTPIYICNEADKPIKVLRIQETMTAFEEGYLDSISQSTYDAMKYALTRVEARVAGE